MPERGSGLCCSELYGVFVTVSGGAYGCTGVCDYTAWTSFGMYLCGLDVELWCEDYIVAGAECTDLG